MRRGRQSEGGYTIVEIMVFLAVSMFMFLVAAFFVQGKQSNTQFLQAMNSINSQVQQVIENVSDSNYTSTDLYCSSNGETFNITSSGGQQGSNIGCSYMGEVMQFGVKGYNGQNYNDYTIAGCQYSGCDSITPLADSPPGNFAEAHAKAVDPGTDDCGSINDVSVNLTSCSQLEWGLYATAMYYYDDSTNGPAYTNSIGFFQSFAQEQASGTGLVSGSQDVLVVTPGSGIDIAGSSNVDETGMVSAINSYLDSDTSSTGIADPDFVVCFTDGHGHIGALTIGGGSAAGASYQHLTTSIQMSNSTIYPFGAANPGFACSTT